MIANIPTKLTYIFYQDGENYPAFISDADNEKTLETGRKWAEGGYWRKRNQKIQEITMDNKPITNIRILDLEVRNEGGRAYKVLVNDKYLVDFREDVLLDCIQNISIVKGKIIGKFIWSRVGSQMKLVRVGSEIYYEIVKSDIAKSAIKIRDFKEGYIYATRGDDRKVFCGKVNNYKLTKENDIWKLKKSGKGYLFMRFYSFDKPDDIRSWYYGIINSPSFVIEENKLVKYKTLDITWLHTEIIKEYNENLEYDRKYGHQYIYTSRYMTRADETITNRFSLLIMNMDYDEAVTYLRQYVKIE